MHYALAASTIQWPEGKPNGPKENRDPACMLLCWASQEWREKKCSVPRFVGRVPERQLSMAYTIKLAQGTKKCRGEEFLNPMFSQTILKF